LVKFRYFTVIISINKKFTVNVFRKIIVYPVVTKLKLNSVALVRKRTIPTERPAKLVPTFADGGCRVASATSPWPLITVF
jgi:hypothetical protein